LSTTVTRAERDIVARDRREGAEAFPQLLAEFQLTITT